MGDKKGNGGFALLCCFIALGVSAVIAFITYLLPIVSDVTVGDNVMNILDIVLSVVTLLGLAFGAFAFAGRHGGFVKVLPVFFGRVFVVAIVPMMEGKVKAKKKRRGGRAHFCAPRRIFTGSLTAAYFKIISLFFARVMAVYSQRFASSLKA